MDQLRVCAKINLDAITSNIISMHNVLSAKAGMYAVIKADGYGHGALPIASYIQNNPHISGFAAATFEEAMELIDGGIKAPVLILGYTFSHTYRDVVRLGIRPTIFTEEMAKSYAHEAASQNKDVHCHIKIDTGMGRIGYTVSEEHADEIASIFHRYPNLIPEGIFTHFARADETDKTSTDLQYKQFVHMLALLEERDVHFKFRHASNSAAIMEYPAAHLDMVRAGIILYGMWPSDEVDHHFPLQPAMSLHSHIVYLKETGKDFAISYGGTYRTKRPSRIATIPVGYGDGYARGLSGKGSVLIHGKRAPIVGRVCMDQFMVDVTDIPEASLLDEVTLLGKNGTDEITMEELGALSGRFNYEFACDLGNRIPRLYYADGELVDSKEYF